MPPAARTVSTRHRRAASANLFRHSSKPMANTAYWRRPNPTSYTLGHLEHIIRTFVPHIPATADSPTLHLHVHKNGTTGYYADRGDGSDLVAIWAKIDPEWKGRSIQVAEDRDTVLHRSLGTTKRICGCHGTTDEAMEIIVAARRDCDRDSDCSEAWADKDSFDEMLASLQDDEEHAAVASTGGLVWIPVWRAAGSERSSIGLFDEREPEALNREDVPITPTIIAEIPAASAARHTLRPGVQTTLCSAPSASPLSTAKSDQAAPDEP